MSISRITMPHGHGDIDDICQAGAEPPPLPVKKTPSAELVEYSDDHISTEFVSRCGAYLRYTGAEHNKWFHWDGSRWAVDTKMLRYNSARETCRNLAASVKNDSLRRGITSNSRVAAIVEMARSDPRVWLDKDSFDSDPLLLTTPKGTVNLQTGAIHQHNPADFITKMTRYPNAEGGCPVFEGFMGDVFEGNSQMVSFMQVALGYCLTGVIKEQVFLFAYGGSKNGKSTLFDVIEEIIGSYGNNLNAAALMSQKNSQHSTDIAMLEGVRAAFTTELDKSQRWNIPVLKSITGNQRIAARKMHQDAGSFPNRVKLIISGNDLPRFEGGDAAMERRILLIPLNAYFSEAKRDRDMHTKLMGEAPQILQWLIDGAMRYFKEGLLVPEAVKSESQKYFVEMDTVKAWAETCLKREDGSFLPSKELLDHYASWGEDAQMSAREFKKHLTRLGFDWKRTKQARGFTGVKFSSEFDA